MKYYLGHVGQFLQPKNKLEKAIQNYIKLYDRKLLPEYDLQLYKIEINDKIKALTAEHSKCTPIKSDWWTPSSSLTDEIRDWVLGGVDCVRFSFMQSREVKL